MSHSSVAFGSDDDKSFQILYLTEEQISLSAVFIPAVFLPGIGNCLLLDAELKRCGMPIQRKPNTPLKLYLMDARQSGRPLEGARLDLVEKFANTYDHARHDPSVSKKKPDLVQTRLLLMLPRCICSFSISGSWGHRSRKPEVSINVGQFLYAPCCALACVGTN